MNKFFTINVNPTFTYTERNNVFSDGDVITDWFAFDVPNGGNNLVSAYMISETTNGTLQTFHPEVFFAKDLIVGNKTIAPASLGALSASAAGGTYQRHILGFLQAEEDIQVATTLDFAFLQRLSTVAQAGQRPDIVLQGEPDTGTAKGLSRIYLAATCVDGDADFRSTVKTNGGGTAGDTTLTVDTSSAFSIISVGDQLIDEDNQGLGIVEAINAAGTTITFDKNGLLNTVADNKRVVSVSPIKFVLGFER